MSQAKTVLLVDDNDELRSATSEYLDELGYRVTAAADAEEALGAAPAGATAGGFDLLVSDVYMPGISGLELADRLLQRQPELAVLLISSRGGEPEVRRRLAHGDVAFLAKPFAPAELAAKVDTAFDRAGSRSDGPPPEAVPVAAVEEPPEAKPRHRLPRRAVQAAGVAVLVLGLGALIRGFEPGPPPQPVPAPGGVTRSATIEPVRPVGPLAATPTELVWQEVDGGSSYAVNLRAIDGKALWQAEVPGPPADVPAEVMANLNPAVTYYWSVGAFDAEHRLVARSELAPFVIELPRGEAVEQSEDSTQPEDRHRG